MKKENSNSCCCEQVVVKNKHHGGCSEALYGLGVIGALFYFLQGAATFMAVMTGIGKAIFWPALIVFRILTMLKI